MPPKATVITEAELAQMKRRAIITSLADEEAARVEREKILEVNLKCGESHTKIFWCTHRESNIARLYVGQYFTPFRLFPTARLFSPLTTPCDPSYVTLQERQRAARARKQRMLEMEVEAKKKALKSDIEVSTRSQQPQPAV